MKLKVWIASATEVSKVEKMLSTLKADLTEILPKIDIHLRIRADQKDFIKKHYSHEKQSFQN